MATALPMLVIKLRSSDIGQPLQARSWYARAKRGAGMVWLSRALSFFALPAKRPFGVGRADAPRTLRSQTAVKSARSHADASKDRTAPSPRADACDDIIIALTQSGLAQGRPDDIHFVRAALDGEEWPKGAALRRHGRPFSKDELRARGYRANLVLSHECFELLTVKGREDPVEASQFIVSALLQRRSVAERIAQTRAIFGEQSTIHVYPNSMAAGSCDACLALSKQPIPLAMAPRGPLPGCPHPSQCVLHWRSISDVGE